MCFYLYIIYYIYIYILKLSFKTGKEDFGSETVYFGCD